jgi:hypothetical protein
MADYAKYCVAVNSPQRGNLLHCRIYRISLILAQAPSQIITAA